MQAKNKNHQSSLNHLMILSHQKAKVLNLPAKFQVILNHMFYGWQMIMKLDPLKILSSHGMEIHVNWKLPSFPLLIRVYTPVVSAIHLVKLLALPKLQWSQTVPKKAQFWLHRNSYVNWMISQSAKAAMFALSVPLLESPNQTLNGFTREYPSQ